MLQLKLLSGLLLCKTEPLKDVSVTIIGKEVTIGPAKLPVSHDFPSGHRSPQNDPIPPKDSESRPEG